MSILFAMAGAGVGFFFLIYDALEIELFSASGSGGGFGFGALPLVLTPLFLMILIAPLVGATLAGRIQEPQQEIFKISAASIAAGTAIVSILSIFLISTTFDGVDLEFGGLILNTLLAAVFAGAVAAGGAWTMLNQYPQ
jgi:hypothetical protein